MSSKAKGIIRRTVVRTFLIVTLPIAITSCVVMSFLTGAGIDTSEWVDMFVGGHL